MSRTYTVSLFVRVFDEGDMYRAAVEQAREDSPNITDAELEDMLGTLDEPNVHNCLRTLADPGVSWAGTEIMDSAVEGDDPFGDDDDMPAFMRDAEPAPADVLPVVIMLDRKGAQPGERASDFIGRFQTEAQATAFLSLSASIDPDDLHEGHYGVCAMAEGEFCDDEPVIFTSTASDGRPTATVTVVRQLTDDEADPEGGPMYEVRFEDGETQHAFGFELTPIATELPEGWDN